ncbi:quinon protein alcohol dehydrogenase-like superfamily [Rhizoctonia solani]|nr:quinon protein alcohol dehydrogenase-like superfamily [Rhizoctonia solani]
MQQVKDAIPDNLVVVIDALDECDDRNGVELVLDILFRHASDVPLKFLITSRPEPEIYSKMSTHAQSREVIHLHDIEKSLVQADIELYLKEELEFMSPPANQAEFEQLVQRSGALFIYAATLVRYIRSGKRLADPHKRLRSVLGMTPESTKKHMHIDTLYTAVLKSALSEDELEPDEIEDVRLVLRTVLFAQEPIGVEIIAELAEIADPQRVLHALHPLRSVLHQSEGTGLVSTLHASFPDFMFSNERSGTYFYDIVEHSQALAHRCFLVMKEQLRFNICNLASSLVPDKEVGNLQKKIKANISPTPSYTCRYWASHLALSPRCDLMLTLLGEFLGSRLLFWIEVLSLLREMHVGIDELLKAQQWLINHVEYASSQTTLFVDDARNFLTGYAINPTSQSTPHLYISSLPFCSHTSLVYQKYWRRSRGLLVLKGSLTKIREAAPLAIWNVGLSINSLALSPDGSQVVIGCSDATLSILSAHNGAFHVGPVQTHARGIGSVAFSPDGGRVVSGSSGDVQVWNARNGTPIAGPFQGHIGSVNSVSFSPDGTRVISGGRDSGIRIWNAYDGTPLLHMNHVDLVRCVVFSPNGALIASSSSDHTIQLWNAYDGTFARPRFQGHMGQVQCLAFTPDGTRLVSGSTDYTVRVWNIPDGSLFNNPFEGHTFFVDSVAVSPDGTRVASAGGGDIRVWNIENGALVAGPFFGQKVSSKSLAYSPDGTRIISGSQYNTICLRSVRDGIFPPAPLPTQYALTRINTVAFCADNAHFMSSTGSGILNIWDTSDGSFVTSPNEIKIIPSPLSTLSYDGSFLAGTSKSGSLQVVDTVDGSLVAGPFDIERDLLSTFQFSRNNDAAIVGCYDGTIKLCELQSGNTAVGSLKGHHKRVSAVTESSDCSLLVSFSDYEMAFRLWNIVAPALNLQLSSPSIDSGSG